MTGPAPPYVAGMEFSGHVHAIGPGVALARGRRVIGVVNPRRPAGGARAQLMVVPAVSVVALAGGTDLVAAATVPMNGLTALLPWMLALPPGRACSSPAAPALGGYAIRLARRAGIRVIARETDAAVLRAAGAAAVVRRDDFAAEARSLFPRGVDGLIDGALIGGRVSHLVTSGGAAISLRRWPIRSTTRGCASTTSRSWTASRMPERSARSDGCSPRAC